MIMIIDMDVVRSSSFARRHVDAFTADAFVTLNVIIITIKTIIIKT